MRAFLHSREGLGLRANRSRFERGLEHDPAPYGFDLAAEFGVALAFSEDGRYAKLSQRLIARLGMDPVHALYNLRAMRRADIIWTVLEWEWLAVSLLQRAGLLHSIPVVGNSVWLFEHWPNFGPKRRAVLKWLMAKNVHLTLHSATALDRARVYLPDRTFELSYFGISNRAFPITAPNITERNDRPLRIYSIGNDGTRDWQTLLDAFGNNELFEVVVVCKWLPDKHDLGRYRNVTCPTLVKVSDQRGFYEWADVVVIPMRENPYSGITVACEAAAMGKPVVSSNTGGVPTYFASDEVVYVAPEDPAALRSAVLDLSIEDMRRLTHRAQQRFKQSGYATREMVERYVTLSRSLLAAEHRQGMAQHDTSDPEN